MMRKRTRATTGSNQKVTFWTSCILLHLMRNSQRVRNVTCYFARSSWVLIFPNTHSRPPTKPSVRPPSLARPTYPAPHRPPRPPIDLQCPLTDHQRPPRPSSTSTAHHAHSPTTTAYLRPSSRPRPSPFTQQAGLILERGFVGMLHLIILITSDFLARSCRRGSVAAARRAGRRSGRRENRKKWINKRKLET